MEVENGVENGVAQLYENGIIQMSWNMKNGVRHGKITIYEDGVAVKMMNWEELFDILANRSQGFAYNLIREIVNVKNGNRLLIERIHTSGIVVYKGEFDPITWKKEGFGIEYDHESGEEKFYGYFHNDELIHIIQMFLKKKDSEDGNADSRIMIEYGGDKYQDNVMNVLNRQPIYKGGYIYNETYRKYVRCGYGCEINLLTGFCDRVGEWDENGEMIKNSSQALKGGWYDEGECDHSIRITKKERDTRDNEQVAICPAFQYTLLRKTQTCEIPSKQMNDKIPEIMPMAATFDDFTSMEVIKIGYSCFKYISEFIIQNMPALHTIEIDRKCCRTDEIGDNSGHFRIENCPQLLQLIIHNECFCYYRSFELLHLDALQTIDIGESCFLTVREFVLDGLPGLEKVKIGKKSFMISNKPRGDGLCRITNCPSLLHLGIGNSVFQDFTQFELANVPSLQSIDFGINCFYYANFTLMGKLFLFTNE